MQNATKHKIAEVLYHARLSGSANVSFAIALLRYKALIIAALTLLIALVTMVIMDKSPVGDTVLIGLATGAMYGVMMACVYTDLTRNETMSYAYVVYGTGLVLTWLINEFLCLVDRPNRTTLEWVALCTLSVGVVVTNSMYGSLTKHIIVPKSPITTGRRRIETPNVLANVECYDVG